MQNDIPVLVQLDVDDNDIARVDADGHTRAVRLVALHTVDMDDPLLPVNLGNLSFTALVLPSDNPDLVVLANGDGAGLRG